MSSQFWCIGALPVPTSCRLLAVSRAVWITRASLGCVRKQTLAVLSAERVQCEESPARYRSRELRRTNAAVWVRGSKCRPRLPLQALQGPWSWALGFWERHRPCQALGGCGMFLAALELDDQEHCCPSGPLLLPGQKTCGLKPTRTARQADGENKSSPPGCLPASPATLTRCNHQVF